VTKVPTKGLQMQATLRTLGSGGCSRPIAANSGAGWWHSWLKWRPQVQHTHDGSYAHIS
jgi:hypothetical protein